MCPMKCISWNVRGLRDDRRRGIVGRYLRQWGAEIICLEETMISQVEPRTWTSLGWGSATAYVDIPASGRSGGILLALKEDLFDQLNVWRGRHVVAAALKNRRDDTSCVVALVYGPTNPSRLDELWEDLRQLYGAFLATSLLIGGDFNVTLRIDDRPNGGGGFTRGPLSFGRCWIYWAWSRWARWTDGLHGEGHLLNRG